MIGERLGDPDVNRKAPDLKPKKSTIAVHPLKLGVAEVTLHPRIPVLEIRFRQRCAGVAADNTPKDR